MDPYLGEIRLFGGNFAPAGWAMCNGQLLSIAENQALFSLMGTTYGGDGQSTFALPDLRDRIPIHRSSTYPLGQKGGTETVTLTLDQVPAHTHVPLAQTAAGTQASPEAAVWAGGDLTMYASVNANATMENPSTTVEGGSQAHNNVMPFLCVNFIIALEGIWPQQN